MVRFTTLDKQEKLLWLPRLFDLLHDNMNAVAPSGMSYDEEKELWLASVAPALDKEPRQIIMCFVDDELAGYIQYYTRDQLLMIEEMQIKKEYQRTMLFCCFCRHLVRLIPDNIIYLEAYADKRNIRSQALMHKLGMEKTDEKAVSPFVHYRGSLQKVRKLLKK